MAEENFNNQNNFGSEPIINLDDQTKPDLNQDTNSDSDTNITPLRTYEGDIRDAVKSEKLSLLKIATKEAERKQMMPNINEISDDDSGEIKRKLFWVAISLLLVIVGGGLIFFGINYVIGLMENKEAVVIDDGLSRIITSDEEEKKEFKDFIFKSDLINYLKEKRTNELFGKNQIKSYLFTKKDVVGENELTTIVSAEDVLNKLQARINQEFLRTIQNEFAVGIHSAERNSPFILIKTNDYERAYSGMLAWEDTMKEDIGEIFFDPISYTRPEDESGAIIEFSYSFIDKIIKNKDARVLVDETGKGVMFYVFLDNEHILISSDESTIDEIMNRLKLVKLVR